MKIKPFALVLPTLLAASFVASKLLIAAPAKSSSAAGLVAARRAARTSIYVQRGPKEPVERAPARIFSTVRYPAPAGQMAAYVTPNPGDGKKHPAIVWITGGDCNSIGDVWSPASASNDQTAAAYRKAGIVMMFPSLRGGNNNPGNKEGFLGEVDDVLAATSYLEKLPYVDPKRIYLGGHSTGGTLVLLVAECSPRFRSVFSFGPVANVSGYGADSGFLPFDISNPTAVKLRSPGYWLSYVQSPTWVFEGTQGTSNIDELQRMQAAAHNSKVHFLPVRGHDHFSILAPMNAVIARSILSDTGPTTNIGFR